ncbi:hypothetical protein [Allorhodopirellula solitaria]|uniref:Uncharacterized protein n=1 Tax=Allorhodopirellula solitaria TaxID=2527987 RepID=A0A5C5X2V8_9BACT|nr:hypothetical protein [Allorhodopirellula solitaria]TWT56503.1 hypothetical protein CA85_40340 [Allorhodopirellula solitaria]
MQTFKDNQGQTWTIALTLGKVRKIREKLGLDLLKPLHHAQILDSLTDQLAFVFLLCEEQAKEHSISIDDFEDRLAGDSVAQDASIAFLEECAFFFHRYGRIEEYQTTRRVIRLTTDLRARQVELATNGRLDSLMDAMETQWRKELGLTDGQSSSS